jgi:type II secretory pathway component GspD/PulD (secretin)
MVLAIALMLVTCSLAAAQPWKALAQDADGGQSEGPMPGQGVQTQSQPGAEAKSQGRDEDPGRQEAKGPVSGGPPWPVTIDLKGADVRDVLKILAELSGANIVSDPSVRGEVSLTLKAVPVTDAVELVTRATGLAYRYVGNSLVVAAPARFKEGFDKVETRVFKLDYSSPGDIKQALSLVIPADKLQVEERTNSVVASGSRIELDEAERIIRKLDVPVPMVRIDARLEEIAKDALDEFGINWQEAGQFGKVFIRTDPVTGAFTGLSLAVGPFLKMLEDSGKAATIARPGTTTLDGTEARIFIGDKIPIIIAGSEGEQAGQSVSFIEAGVKLVITPRVNRNGLITVHVRPEVSSILGQEKTQGYPHVRTREADFVATVRDGETLAIAGLLQREEIDSMLKLPILGDIPILGALFRSRKVEARETEMVIFITPTIVTVNDAKTLAEPAKTGEKETEPVTENIQVPTMPDALPGRAAGGTP